MENWLNCNVLFIFEVLFIIKVLFIIGGSLIFGSSTDPTATSNIYNGLCVELIASNDAIIIGVIHGLCKE